MKCPECGAAIESQGSCTSCGLVVVNVIPERRKDDLQAKRRRESDQSLIECPYCRGSIPADALRCRHCTAVVNEQHYRELMYRRRQRVNYASWIFYILGLLVFLIFRPVGVISIGAGLLLSIVYYALPSETTRAGEKTSFRAVFQRRLKPERIEVPVPHAPKLKMIFVGTPVFAAVLGYFANFLLLQQPMNKIINANSAFAGIHVSTHYEYWVVPGVIVYDLESLKSPSTPLDVHTALLEYANRLKAHQYRRIDLEFRGEKRFSIDGTLFRKVGEEYSKHNFAFVLFQFPRLLRSSDGRHLDRASNSGDADALMQFHKRWYVDELRRELQKDQQEMSLRPTAPLPAALPPPAL